MKKTLSIIGIQITIPSLIVLCVLFTPLFAYAGAVYSCVDKDGNEIITDNPIDAKACKQVGTFHDMTDQEKSDYEKERKEADQKNEEEFQKRKDREDAKEKLEACLEQAVKHHRENWDQNCRSINSLPGCFLPPDTGKQWDDKLQEEKNECIRLNAQNPGE
jgi:hypothetical protein